MAATFLVFGLLKEGDVIIQISLKRGVNNDTRYYKSYSSRNRRKATRK
jgi:hypothetical protein